MTLINTMLHRPLDPGYAAQADRRRAAGLPPSTGLRSPLLLVASIVIGLLVTVAASSLRATETSKTQARADLVSRITSQQERVDGQRARLQVLRGQVAAGDAAALGGGDPEGAARLRALSVSTGAVAVEGPGFVVTLDDAPGGEVNAGGDPRNGDEGNDARVFSRDLQIVTNSLWESGAEAISINGQRLTSKSAIRFAGQAILVDFRPLARPYVVTAIGDPASLPSTFAQGSGGTYLTTLRNSFGIQVTTTTRQHVTVPATGSLTTRVARAVDTAAGASTATGAPRTTPSRPSTATASTTSSTTGATS